MKLKLTPAYVFTFLMLTFVLSEFHEIAHTAVGRLICGCWGKRDFNQWGLCEGCENNPYSFIPTMMGPLFSFSVAYWGASMLKKHNTIEKQTLGFSLIFASSIFGRLLNVFPFQSGDEFTVFYNEVFNEQRTISLIAAFVLVAVIVFYPLRKAYLFIENKNRWAWFLGFCILPFVAVLLMILGVLNSILATGFLGKDWILGSPKVVTLWTILVIVLLFLSKANITQLKSNGK
jgi:hypothetical protein